MLGTTIKIIITIYVIRSQERFIGSARNCLPTGERRTHNKTTDDMTVHQSANPQHYLPLRLDPHVPADTHSVLHFISHVWFRRMLTLDAGSGTHVEPSLPLLSGVKPSFYHNIKTAFFFSCGASTRFRVVVSPSGLLHNTGYTTLCRTPLDE
jgi:hypothetical protein